MEYLIFLKLKSDEVAIKGRGCADVRKQGDWLSKEDTSSQTVSTEGLMLSCMIDTIEGREVASTNILGAILQTDYYKGDIYIKLEGDMVILLEEIDLEYYKYFIYTEYYLRKCMYAESKKAIYGTLEVSLLFWGKLSKSLEEMRYQRNEYDWCVMKKIVDNKQCTILWHVDDLKTSQFNPAIISSVFADIDAEYLKVAKMTITRGKVNKYLGMTIDYSLTDKLILSISDYIVKCLKISQNTQRGNQPHLLQTTSLTL